MPNDNEIYAELVTATPQELLEAAIWFYSQHCTEAEYWMRLGFALAQRGGWELVAPAWLRDWRTMRDNARIRMGLLLMGDTGE